MSWYLPYNAYSNQMRYYNPYSYSSQYYAPNQMMIDGSHPNHYYAADGIKASSIAKFGFKVVFGIAKFALSQALASGGGGGGFGG